MRLLLTNDDGVDAPGLRLLEEIAADFGEVWVVAPDQERSGVSHAISLFRPLRMQEVAERRYACSGTPTDCVYLALNQMKLDVDVVLSGINPGPNLAHDVLYSGTVSAAMEGAHWGIPSIALSHCSSDLRLLPLLRDVVGELLKTAIPVARRVQRTININIPPADRMPFAGVMGTKLGHRVYSNEVHERSDPRGRAYYWIGGAKVTMKDLPGSDCNAVRDNWISLTPLGSDLTAHGDVVAIEDEVKQLRIDGIAASGPPAQLDPNDELPIGFPFE